MSGYRLFKDKLLDKFDKFTQKWNEFVSKITTFNKSLSLRLSEFSSKFDEMVENLQTEDLTTVELIDGLKKKALIKGEITFQNVEEFTKTLWESHDIAQQVFQETNDPQYHEIAVETLLVIREMEQLKEYLWKIGKK
ncbi:MAG: hypothetical protein ACTSRS_07135 [Candidatus Helarchaeota archaeon]